MQTGFRVNIEPTHTFFYDIYFFTPAPWSNYCARILGLLLEYET